jgi:ParB family chromosome partitioning protein
LQPRKDFPPEALQELADSIREQGIIQPLIVRAKEDDFELIAGERRLRAAQTLGLKEVPIIVRAADDRSVLEMMLIENLQRENLNPIEEALGYQELIEQFRLTQEEVATKVGRSRAAVTNALRLLKLEPVVQHFVREGKVSVGHAKVILGLPQPTEQARIAQKVLTGGLSVRQTEELVTRLQQQAKDGSGIKGNRNRGRDSDAHVAEIQNRLRECLGTKVQLRYRQGKGRLEIHFYNDEDLERILQLLGIEPD